MSRTDVLFQPFSLKTLQMPNRLVMAPMTRSFSPGGVPGDDVAAYYRRRVEGGTGLIVTEGTAINDPAAINDPKVPRFHGEDALAGWAKVVKEVKAAGGLIMPQLWHVGMMRKPGSHPNPDVDPVGPSGLFKPGKQVNEPMTPARIDQVIAAYAQGAADAKRLGFDGIELHGAHGYLIDQFFWDGTNVRDDRWGGNLPARAGFAAEAVKACRAAAGEDFPIILRFSQWKQQDYAAKLAPTPQELEKFLAPLAAAGVDIFHCSTRRLWEPEFDGSDMNLAGWTKKLTGKATITVGSVGLNQEFVATFRGEGAAVADEGLNRAADMVSAGEVDLVAVGRALIATPDWPNRLRAGTLASANPYDPKILAELV